MLLLVSILLVYQPLKVAVRGVWTIGLKLKTVTPVAAVEAAASAGNDDSAALALCFWGRCSPLLLRLDLDSFQVLVRCTFVSRL